MSIIPTDLIDCEPFQKGYYLSHLLPEKESTDSCVLDQKQTTQLDTFKINQLRENHQYLKEHPEIKQFIHLLISVVCLERPKGKIRPFLCNFFMENINDIKGLLGPSYDTRDTYRASTLRTSLIEKLKQKRRTTDEYADIKEEWSFPRLASEYKSKQSTRASKSRESKSRASKSSKGRKSSQPKPVIRLVKADFGFYGCYSESFYRSEDWKKKDIGIDNQDEDIGNQDNGIFNQVTENLEVEGAPVLDLASDDLPMPDNFSYDIIV